MPVAALDGASNTGGGGTANAWIWANVSAELYTLTSSIRPLSLDRPSPCAPIPKGTLLAIIAAGPARSPPSWTPFTYNLIIPVPWS